jgi:hypothetical protein
MPANPHYAPGAHFVQYADDSSDEGKDGLEEDQPMTEEEELAALAVPTAVTPTEFSIIVLQLDYIDNWRQLVSRTRPTGRRGKPSSCRK